MLLRQLSITLKTEVSIFLLLSMVFVTKAIMGIVMVMVLTVMVMDMATVTDMAPVPVIMIMNTIKRNVGFVNDLLIK